MKDRHEQTMRIYDMEVWDRQQQYKRNNEDLMQMEQWEDVTYRVQQLE
jgi:hypothetical protein